MRRMRACAAVKMPKRISRAMCRGGSSFIRRNLMGGLRKRGRQRRRDLAVVAAAPSGCSHCDLPDGALQSTSACEIGRGRPPPFAASPVDQPMCRHHCWHCRALLFGFAMLVSYVSPDSICCIKMPRGPRQPHCGPQRNAIHCLAPGTLNTRLTSPSSRMISAMISGSDMRPQLTARRIRNGVGLCGSTSVR
jgi:hypothetical protein